MRRSQFAGRAEDLGADDAAVGQPRRRRTRASLLLDPRASCASSALSLALWSCALGSTLGLCPLQHRREVAGEAVGAAGPARGEVVAVGQREAEIEPVRRIAL